MESLAAIRRFFELVKIAVMVALVLAIVGVAIDAHAQTACPTGAVASDAARVCWRNPTENTDGSPITAEPPVALVEAQVRRSVCASGGGMGAIVETLTVPATVGVVLFTGLPPARHCFQVRVRNGIPEWSAWTGVVDKTTTAPAPPKPRQPNATIS